MSDYTRLYKQLGYQFSDEALLTVALSHRSKGASNYERLEFLGDGLLNFVIADALYHRHRNLDEGALSRLRASLVRGTTLAEIARELHLGEYLLMGAGEFKSGGFDRDSVLADVVESILGAVFLESGFDHTKSVIIALFAERLNSLPTAASLKDAKTRLQELLQGLGEGRPDYAVLETSGEAHKLQFTVSCSVAFKGVLTTAKASSRRKAEQMAAEAALNELEEVLNLS